MALVIHGPPDLYRKNNIDRKSPKEGKKGTHKLPPYWLRVAPRAIFPRGGVIHLTPPPSMGVTWESDRTKILLWGRACASSRSWRSSEVLRDRSFSIIKSRVPCYLGSLKTIVLRCKTQRGTPRSRPRGTSDSLKTHRFYDMKLIEVPRGRDFEVPRILKIIGSTI